VFSGRNFCQLATLSNYVSSFPFIKLHSGPFMMCARNRKLKKEYSLV
jgi:hypothetical protein